MRAFEFVRCQRADGSHYGTAGKCQKGREVDAADVLGKGKTYVQIVKELKGKKELGEGAYGRVYDVGGGVVVKQGKISDKEINALERLNSVEGVPRVLGHQYKNPSAKSAQKAGILAMTKAPGVPMVEVTAETMIGMRDKKDFSEAVDAVLGVLKEVHSKGIGHNDLHQNNMFYDSATKKATIIDFGLSKSNDPKSQLDDVLRFIDSPGDRYRAASGPRMNVLRDNVQGLRMEGMNVTKKYDMKNADLEMIMERLWDGV